MAPLHWLTRMVTRPSPAYTWELFRVPSGFVRRIYRHDGTHLVDVPLRMVILRGTRPDSSLAPQRLKRLPDPR